ncbi:hypothetical protein DY000_02040231 [Brassica cretica]|uniref:Uncharacterized protein n=1 Tax=Brassica cretica TaxID=69181 RepID=A0ABQ7BJ96_BRACR|nr:hypothetical protein DY000_02040231 [Brassica cretica]
MKPPPPLARHASELVGTSEVTTVKEPRPQLTKTPSKSQPCRNPHLSAVSDNTASYYSLYCVCFFFFVAYSTVHGDEQCRNPRQSPLSKSVAPLHRGRRHRRSTPPPCRINTASTVTRRRRLPCHRSPRSTVARQCRGGSLLDSCTTSFVIISLSTALWFWLEAIMIFRLNYVQDLSIMSRDYVRGRGFRDVWTSDAAFEGGGPETSGLAT